MENNTANQPLRGPKPGGTEPVAPMSRARAAVLDRLRGTAGTVTVETLAKETGQHTNTIREHLEALVAGGFAARTTAPRTGRGRPAWLYSAPIAAVRPGGYAALAAALVEHIASTSSDPAAAGENAGRQWAHALEGGERAAGHETHPRRSRAVRRHVVEQLQRAGFGVEANAAATELNLTSCPILEAARKNPDVVCAVHLGLVRGLAENSNVPQDGIRLTPFAAPGACTLQLPHDAGKARQ